MWSPARFELASSGSVGRRVDHCATGSVSVVDRCATSLEMWRPARFERASPRMECRCDNLCATATVSVDSIRIERMAYGLEPWMRPRVCRGRTLGDRERVARKQWGPIRIERMSSLVSYRAHRPLCYGPRNVGERLWGPTRFERVSSSLQDWCDDLCATSPGVVGLDQREDLAGACADDRDQLVQRCRCDRDGAARVDLLADDAVRAQPTRTFEHFTGARTEDRCECV